MLLLLIIIDNNHFNRNNTKRNPLCTPSNQLTYQPTFFQLSFSFTTKKYPIFNFVCCLRWETCCVCVSRSIKRNWSVTKTMGESMGYTEDNWKSKYYWIYINDVAWKKRTVLLASCVILWVLSIFMYLYEIVQHRVVDDGRFTVVWFIETNKSMPRNIWLLDDDVAQWLYADDDVGPTICVTNRAHWFGK